MSPTRNARFVRLLLTGLVLAAAAPTAAGAWLGFRNDTPHPVVVQTSTVLSEERARPHKPQVLYPGEVAWQSVVQSGSRIIVFEEARKPGRQLYRLTVLCGAEDQFYSLQAATGGPAQVVPVRGPRALRRAGP